MGTSEPSIMHGNTQEPLLYRLRDGRFQIVKDGELGPILCGPDYVLVNRELGKVLHGLCGSDLQFEPASIVDPAAKVTRTDFLEICARQELTPEMLSAGEALIGNAWLCGKGTLIVSRQVRDAIAMGAIAGVQFSPPIFFG
jgi:hypothetical protein